MALARYKTAGEVLNRAGRKLGLDEVTDPVASTDPEWKRLKRLLDEVGQELAEDYEWTHLLVEKTIVGDGATTTYDLPADFLDMVPQSGWNRAVQVPMQGPLSPQVWQYRKAATPQPVYAEFRLDVNQIRFTPAIANAQTVAFEYKSRAWVRPAASGLGNGNTLSTAGADEVSVTGDFVLYDPLLVHRMLVLAWREDNGMRTDHAQAAATRSLDRAKERSAPGAVLDLTGRRRRNLPEANIPDGSWPV